MSALGDGFTEVAWRRYAAPFTVLDLGGVKRMAGNGAFQSQRSFVELVSISDTCSWEVPLSAWRPVFTEVVRTTVGSALGMVR